MRHRPMVAGVSLALAVVLALVIGRHLRSRPASPGTTAPPAQQTAAGPPAAGPASAAPPSPTPRHLLADIIEQGVTPERAKLLFSMAVGPLPGVTVPAAQRRDPTDFDGTLAVGYITQEWDSLTPEQRRAADRLIHPARRSPGGQRSASAAPRSMVLPVAYVPAMEGPAYDYNTLARNADATIAAFVAQQPVTFTLDTNYGPPPGSEAAHTWSWFISPLHPDESYKDVPYPSGCEITINDQAFRPFNATDAQAIITHEMFHCFQQRVAGSASRWWSVRAWILEGQPSWVMQAVVPGVSGATMDSVWLPYVREPTKPFINRSYDADGVYAHLADLAGDAAVWPKLLPMFGAGMGGISSPQVDVNAFDFLIAGHEVTYFTDWGSSYFEVNQKTPWDMLTRIPAGSKGPEPQPVTVDNTTTEMLPAAGQFQGELFHLDGSADIVIVSLLTGYGRLHDEGFKIDEALDVGGPLALCLSQGGCKCPDGSAGASLFTKPATRPIAIGINGGDHTTQVGVAGESLDKFCKQPDPPAPPNASAGGGGERGGPPISGDSLPSPPEGASRGDPHVATIDGLNYDLQTVGEYTLVKSTKDDFVVQVRMVPVRGSDAVSMNQAIATTLDGHRVTVAIENATEVLRVDGKEVLGEPPAPLRGAVLCTETMYGPSCQLNWPDGTIVRATQIERFALNVDVRPARARLGTLAGLLGDGDGSTANDLVGLGGASLGTSPSPQAINRSLADRWRVRSGASLFDYLPGQSSRTFADTTFPRSDAGRLANRDSAERVCRQEGITDVALLDDCVTDLAATNNVAYASVYSHTQRVADARAALRQTAMRGVVRTLYMDGTITDTSRPPVFTFAAKDSDVIWIDSTGCKDGNGTIVLHPLWHLPGDASSTWDLQQNALPLFEPGLGDPTRVSACRAGRLKLMAGTIALLATPLKGAGGGYHIPIRFIRHDHIRAITYGTTVDGEIENPAARDVYTFIGHPGDIIRISGDGCDLGHMITGVVLPGQYAQQGPVCSGGDFTVPPRSAAGSMDSTTQFIINFGNNAGRAKYHFVFRGAPAKN